MSSISLREKIMQTVVLGNNANIPGNCGGQMVGSEIIKNSPEGAAEAFKKIMQLQSEAKLPLLIPGDLEAGCGFAISSLTKLPYLMGLGATDDKGLAYKFGLITGKEARSIGMNWAFAPVSDLNLNPRNPVTNMRSLGDDADKAIPMLKEIIKGMQDGGIAACVKHFPGDGVDYRDQHIVTTSNSLSYEEYMKNHGRVFQEVLSEAYSVMIGHISLPCFQKERIDGMCPPATLSREIMVELLRGEMGFKGVAVSDALNMGGYLGWYKDERESNLMTFKNGCDMLLWPNEHYVDDVVDAVENGFIPTERVNEAYDRVMSMKEKLGLLSGNFSIGLSYGDKEMIANATEEIYSKSITLVCDKTEQLPFGRSVKKIALVPLGSCEEYGACIERAKECFKSHGIETDVFDCELWIDSLKNIAREHDKIVYMIFTQPHHPAGPLELYGKSAICVWSSLTHGREKTVVASFGSPYFYKQYFERALTFINAYTPDPKTVETVVKALTESFDFKGCSPVKL